MRINRYLSDSGYCSRRAADQLITEGKVTINGKLAVLGDKVGKDDMVKVDNLPISPPSKKHYIAFNKPVGIICTTDTRVRSNIVNYINYPERIFPVGRLDKDSEGLILLTSDGNIVNQVLRAENNNHKEYEVVLDKPLEEVDLESMRRGVVIFNPAKNRHTKARAVDIKIFGKGGRKITMILDSGLNRQIRRMFMALGYEVLALKRIRIMHIKIGKLKSGQWRHLSNEEVAGIFAKKKK